MKTVCTLVDPNLNPLEAIEALKYRAVVHNRKRMLALIGVILLFGGAAAAYFFAYFALSLLLGQLLSLLFCTLYYKLPYKKPPYTILSIDGGGVRGVIPATICQKLEEQAGKPIREIFDCLIGSSTGGIIALGLTKKNPLKASELVDLYLKRAKDIFVKYSILPFFYLFSPEYSDQGIENVLKEFKVDGNMDEISNDVVITSYDVKNHEPCLFKNGAGDVPIAVAARATSAAPTYFPSKTYKDRNLVDGGVYANDPTFVGLLEAEKDHPDLKDRDIFILSIGTGWSKEEPIAKENMGTFAWVRPLLDTMFDASNQMSEGALRFLSKYQGLHYMRANPEISTDHQAMDNINKDNLEYLHKIALEYFKSISEIKPCPKTPTEAPLV